MNRRIIEFDYIRIISLIGILVCHSLLDSWIKIEWLGRLLGMTFNFLFLILSAFLFGIDWEKKRYPKYDIQFLKNRVIKLSRSYYPYLVLLFSLLYLTQGFIPLHKILFHIFYLPWFDKIEGYGHLWFLTMIVICYIGCLVVTRIPVLNIPAKSWYVIFLLSILLGFTVSEKGLPGYLFPYLISYIFVFLYSSTILTKVRRISNFINLVQFVVITSIVLISFNHYRIDPYSYLSYILGILQAISLFCLIFNFFKSFPSLKLVIFLSGISFEVYLVHEFLLGHYSIYDQIQSPIFSILLFLIFSIFLGYLLNKVSKLFSR